MKQMSMYDILEKPSEMASTNVSKPVYNQSMVVL